MTSEKSEIQRIKIQIAQTRQDLVRKEHLLAERETLDLRLTEVDEQRQARRAENPELDKERSQIKKRIIAIDHELDPLDEDLDGKLITLRQDLIALQLTQHPHHTADHDEKNAELEQGRKVQAELRALEEASKRVLHELEQALSVWEAGKSRSLLHRLFGTDPAILASKHIEEAQKQAQMALSVIREYVQHTASHIVVRDAHPMIEKFLAQAQQITGDPWGLRKIDEHLSPHQRDMSKLIERIQSQVKATESLIENLEREIDRWSDSLE